MAGLSENPMQMLNQHRCLPHHQNDDGTATLTQQSEAPQVDNKPPRFELISSDNKSEGPSMSHNPSELGEIPPVAEVMPTTLQQNIMDSSATVPTVPMIRSLQMTNSLKSFLVTFFWASTLHLKNLMNMS